MSKPKAIRSCAFCGLKTEKSRLIRVNLPDLSFDFYQNKNFRSFYVCGNSKCIIRVFKKYAVRKHIDAGVENIESILVENIKNELSCIISNLFEKNGVEKESIKDYTSFILCKENTGIKGENIIPVNSIYYKGSNDVCVIENKFIANLLMNYKNLIIDGI